MVHKRSLSLRDSAKCINNLSLCALHFGLCAFSMSGHSHYATIKRQKESKDAARGKTFSKLARAIQIAVKTGAGPDPDSNPKLRMAIEAARSANMPKDNVERAISKGAGTGGALEEVSYEGYAPGGVAVIVEVATDNRNRTGQEIKNIFERGGGSLAGPGAVSFNFEPKGLIVVEKGPNVSEQMLSLIDSGAEDVEETEDGVEVYVSPEKLSKVRDDFQNKGFIVNSFELTRKPKRMLLINDPSQAKKILGFLATLEEHDDVQKVYVNLDIPDEVLQKT